MTLVLFGIGLFMPDFPVIPDELLTSPAYSEEIVLATVNDVPVYESELDALIKDFKQRAGKDEVTADEKKQLVRNLTIRRLILQHPETQALKNDEQIVKMVEAYKQSLIVSYFVREHVDKNVSITEGELRQYYEANKSEYQVSAALLVRVILLKTLEDAENILAKLNQGEDFAELATQYSVDVRSAKSGGSIGVIERDKIDPKIWSAISRLKEGEISGIIETDFGFNIALVEKVVAPETYQPFEEAKDEIRLKLLPQKREKAYDEMVSQLEKDADIKIFASKIPEASQKSP